MERSLPSAHGVPMPRLLSINQACSALGISRTSVYSALATGRLRSVTVGRRRLVPADAIEDFVAALPTGYGREE
jgi:excisionase family DNA binding protein